MTVTEQINPIDRGLGDRLQAIANSRSNEGYDDLREPPAPTPNALSPGQWLTECCLPGRWSRRSESETFCDSATEESESARAIAESYGYLTYQRLLRYPLVVPVNSDGKELFFECWRDTNPARNFFDEEATQPTSFQDHRSDKSAYVSAALKEERAVKPEKADKTAGKDVFFAYRIVKDADLNRDYAESIVGKATAELVLTSVWNFVLRKLHVGREENTLRDHGAENIAGTFYAKMQPLVEQKRFVSRRSKFKLFQMVPFATFVRGLWQNHVQDAYRELKRYDKVFQLSVLTDRDKFDSDENVSKEDAPVEDKWAIHLASMDRNPASGYRLSELTAADHAMVRYSLNVKSRIEIGEILGKSRHSVKRGQNSIKSLVRKSRDRQWIIRQYRRGSR